jgi:predicted ribosomally synthesized peptide with SipW-like signal peptide
MKTGTRRRLYALTMVAGLLAAAPLTQAYFTDTQDVDANTFTTGTVNISTTPTTALITFSNMAPGDAVTDDIAVSNAGSLALRYAISSVATNADSKGLKDQLALTIKTQDVDTIPDANPCDDFDSVTTLYTGDMDSTAGKLVGDSAQGSQSGDRTLAASANETLCFRASLPVATGNTFQNATTTATFTFAAEQTANN